MAVRSEQLLHTILSGRSDANVRFHDLRNLPLWLGFIEWMRGWYLIFRKPDVLERVNLQRDGSHAKPYQVRQVRRVILKYKLDV